MTEPPNVDPASLPPLAHGVRASNSHAPDAWNFSLAGTRSAIELLARAEGTASPRDLDIERLTNGPVQQWPGMFMSGFMVAVWQATILRGGGQIGYGVPPRETRWVPEESAAQTLRAADREIAFEACRRRVAPHAASRLGCIWAAEDTLAARNWIGRMLGADTFVVPVVVRHAVRVSRCDARWLDRWLDLGEPAAEGYWSGTQEGEEPRWEYLIEGQIACSDEEVLERISTFVRQHGMFKDLAARAHGDPDTGVGDASHSSN